MSYNERVSRTREADTRDAHVVGSGGTPGIGGVAPGAYVDATGNDVPVCMPDEIMLSGGMPFWPTGTDTDEDGDVFVAVDVDDVKLLPPVDTIEPGDGTVEEGAGPVLLAGGDDEDVEPKCILLAPPAASSTWRR